MSTAPRTILDMLHAHMNPDSPRRDDLWAIPEEPKFGPIDGADFSWGIAAERFREILSEAQEQIRDIAANAVSLWGTQTDGDPLCDHEIPAEGTE